MNEEITIIGVGQAGGNLLLDFLTFREYSKNVNFNVVYFNSNEQDFNMFVDRYNILKRKNKKFPVINLQLYARAVRRGIGGNFILSELLITDFLKERISDELNNIFIRSKAVIILHSLAGGTGGGGAPVLAKWLRENTHALVLPFSVLHGSSIKGEKRYKFNTMVNLGSIYQSSDIVFLFDNEVISKTIEQNRVKTPNFEDPRNAPIIRTMDTLLAPSFLDSYPVFDFADLQNLLYLKNGLEIKTVFPEIFPIVNEPTTAGIGKVIEESISIGRLCNPATIKKIGIIIVSNVASEILQNQANTYINIINRSKGQELDAYLYLTKYDKSFKSALLLSIGPPPFREYISAFASPEDFSDDVLLYIKRVEDLMGSNDADIDSEVYDLIKGKYCDLDGITLSNRIWDELNTYIVQGDSNDE